MRSRLVAAALGLGILVAGTAADATTPYRGPAPSQMIASVHYEHRGNYRRRYVPPPRYHGYHHATLPRRHDWRHPHRYQYGTR